MPCISVSDAEWMPNVAEEGLPGLPEREQVVPRLSHSLPFAAQHAHGFDINGAYLPTFLEVRFHCVPSQANWKFKEPNHLLTSLAYI
jgi:hypothetical protein